MSDAAREALESWERQDKPFHEHATELAAALRAEVKRWANARGDAVDFAIERDVLAAIVRDLAEVSESRVWDGQYGWCDICQDAPHTDDCAYRRARAWLASQEPKT